MINQYEGFLNKVIEMLTQGILKIEELMGKKVSIVDEFSKNKEVCWVQFTAEGLPKLVITRPIIASKGNYNVLPQNYGYFFYSVQRTLVFQVEVGGLTCNGRCFTLEELEKQKEG